jgi:hypothetical protein
VTSAGSGIGAHSRPSWLSAECRPAAKGHVPCMRASLRPPPPSARSPAIRAAQHLSVASTTVGTNSATDVRVSAETAMQHTMVIACVTVISEPLGKLPIRLVRRLANGGSVMVRDHPLSALHHRHLTPSCGRHAPTAERTLDPARIIGRELDPRPGIREQPGSTPVIENSEPNFRKGWN